MPVSAFDEYMFFIGNTEVHLQEGFVKSMR